MPGLEVGCFSGPDAEKNPQHVHISYPLRQRWIEAASALFDESEVEAGGEGDRLEVVRNVKGGDIGRAGQVIIGSGNAVRFTMVSA